MKSYIDVADNIIEYLFESQVIAEDQIIDISKNIGILKTRLIRKDKNEYRYYIKRKNKNSILISLDKDFKKFSEIKINEFFRTDFSNYVGNKAVKEIKVKHISKKLKAVHGLHVLFYRVITYFLKTRRFKEIPNMVRFFNSELSRQKSGDLSDVPGVTWKLVYLSKNKVVLKCCDSGGIYDWFINDEGTYYPPQVPGDYYADAYSAYCFTKKYLDTKNKSYLKAALQAINFVINHYDDYKPTRMVWPHKDFKNLPIIETYKLLLNKIDKKNLLRIKNFIKNMNENFYESTNIFALKYNWHHLRKSLGFQESKNRIKYCIKRIEAEQTKSGLIKDNFYIYHNSCDLTYHLYALAFLANTINYGNLESKDVFLKGAKFSLNLTSPDGEVSYLGRGANNMYQVVSAVYIFETAAKLLKNSNLEEAKQFKRAAFLVFKNLLKWQDKKGYFPTSLNKYGNLRLAWNHCETPYNAQSAYFLIKLNLISDKLKQTNIPLEKSNTLTDFSDSNYIAARLKNYFIVLFKGTEKSFAWSGGKHFNGLPGIALLGSKNLGTFSLILDEAKDINLPVTDLPYLNLNSLYGKVNLNIINKNPLIVKFNNSYMEKYYICMQESLIQIVKNNADSKMKFRNIFSAERVSWKNKMNYLKSDEIKIKPISDNFKIYKANIPNPRGVKSIVVECIAKPKSNSAIIIYFNKKNNLDDFVKNLIKNKFDQELIIDRIKEIQKVL